MARHLLEAYARLLTTDTRACADLFAPDAEYTTRVGSQLVHLRGREDIERFLVHVPRQICFRAGNCRREGDGYRGEVHVRYPDLEPRRQSVLYRVADGLIQRFQNLSA